MTVQTMKANEHIFKVKDPISALTHFIGFVFAIIGLALLLIRGAAYQNERMTLISYAVFMISMVLLYGASTSYHSFNSTEKINRILKKIDHMSIFVLIAGTYTPVCLTCLKDSVGRILLICIWAIAIVGMIVKFCWIYCPKWFSSVIYCLMGWAVLSVFPVLLKSISTGAFVLLLTGGIFYTVGAVIYALKPHIFHNKYFGNYELFHCFVLAGSLCHFLMVYNYLTLIG